MHTCVLNSLTIFEIITFHFYRLIVQILLFGSENYDSTANKIIISSIMEFIIKSKRFEDALIQW